MNKKTNKAAIAAKPTPNKPSCGLCGKRGKLTKTECCDQWICDDTGKYVMFSYARNSCFRNHDRYTLCSSHYHNEHKGHWNDCTECQNNIDTEMYVWYGTNEYNFEKLKIVPKYEPTKCSQCGTIIILSEGGYSSLGKDYLCEKCTWSHTHSSKNFKR